MRMAGRSVLGAVCWAALALACKPKGPVAPDDAEVDAAGIAAVAAAPVMPAARAAQMLPPGTGLVVVVESPARLAQVLERDRVVATFASEYDALRVFFTSVLGFDPLDPQSYAAIGIDPQGPAGFAIIDPAKGIVAFFASVADAGKIKAAARDAAGRQRTELQERDFGGAVVLRPPEDENSRHAAIVLRDQMAMLVIPTRDEPAGATAEKLATLASNDALARARGYRRAMGGYDGGDVLVFVDPVALVERGMAAADAAPPSENWADEQAKAAKERGAAPEEIAKLEAQAEEMRKNDQGWQRRDEAAREGMSMLTSGVEGVGLRLSAKASGVFIEGRAALSQDAFLRRAFANVPGRALLPTAMSGEPMLVLSGGVDMAALQPWIDLVLQSDGSSWSDLSATVKRETDIDLDRDLVPHIKGDVGFAVTLDEPLDFGKVARLKQSIGVGAHARIDDPAAVRSLLEKAAASQGKVGSRMKKDGDRYVLDIPDYRKVWVEVAGEHLLVSTDAQLGVRVARDTRGMMGRQTDPPEAWSAMMMPDRAAVYAQDHRFFAFMFAGSAEMASSPEPGHLADVPLSRAAKAKQKQIDAVDEKIEASRGKQVASQLQQIDAIVAPFGTLVVTAAIDEIGIDFLGGQFTRTRSMGEIVESTLTAIVRREASRGDEELFRLFDERARLESELMQIREADAAKLSGKKRGGAAKPKK